MGKLNLHLFGGDGLHQVAAGVEVKGRVPVLSKACNEYDVCLPLIGCQALRQPHPGVTGHFNIQKDHIHRMLPGKFHGILTPAEAVQLRFRRGLTDGL